MDLESIVSLNPHVAPKSVIQNNIDKVNYGNNLSPAPVNQRGTVIDMRPPEVNKFPVINTGHIMTSSISSAANGTGLTSSRPGPG